MTWRTLAVFAVLAVCSRGARADGWPQFRGPDGNGLSDGAKLATEWGLDKNVQWKKVISGVGWSSPIVVGDKVFVATAITEKQPKPKPFDYSKFDPKKFDFPKDGKFPKDFKFPKGMGNQKPPDAVYRFELLCLDRSTGEVIWKKTALERKPTIPTFSSNGYASETPVTDGERVYVYFAMHGLFCYDLSGKKIWEKDLGAFPMAMGFGTGSSPVLADGLLFIQCDNEEKSFLVALDPKSGDEIWRKDRSSKSSWSTPFVWKTKQRTQIVVCGEKKVMAYDPKKGKVLWEMGGIIGTFMASPAADADRIYFGNSGPFTGGQLFAVKAGASGDITLKDGETSNAGVAWVRPKAGPGISSPLAYDGFVYVLDRGMLSCYDAKTGEPAYSRERLKGGSGFTSSPWASAGKIYCLDEDGQTFVVKAGREFELLGKNSLNEMFWASPAVAGDAMILRGVEHLFCIKK
jgi:outer membrane protein assembly factor BamB